jgi:2-succinyl-6-hydroxy-2,4-cyclohexadiene-1-carboxylate synthase
VAHAAPRELVDEHLHRGVCPVDWNHARGVEAPTVTFVPGFMQLGEAWQPVADRLAPSYPTACLDFTTYTFEERIGELLDAAPRGAAIVGYSMGARLALHAALRAPDRLSALVLVGVTAGIEDAAERADRRRSDESLAEWMERSSIEEVVARWEQTPVLATQPAELRQRQRPGRLSHDPEKLAQLLRSAGQAATPPVWDRLATLAMPVLLTAGEQDRRYATAARRMAERLPNARVRLIEGAGHAPQLEAPEPFTALLREFLDEHLGHRAVVDRDP